MKVTIYKDEEEWLTRDYDLTNCSIDELENSLIDHCEKAGADPKKAAVGIVRNTYSSDADYLIKGANTDMSMRDVAMELLYFAGRK